MAGSTNSEPNIQPTATESMSDLSQNLDEALDLELALASLGGLRHSASCEAAERSQRRYDDRNHRLHEARMKNLGLEEGEQEGSDEMSQQVLIRSPIVHNHYGSAPALSSNTSVVPPGEPATQPPPNSDSQTQRRSILPYLLTALIGGGLGAGSVSLPGLLADKQSPPAAVDTDTQYEIDNMRISSGEEN